MADESPAPAPSAAPANGNGVKRDQAIARTLGACILALCAIAGFSIWKPPAQWDLVNKAADGIITLSLILVGGLGVKTQR